MTIEEFSNEFDILYNNIMSNQAMGLNEYEKSVFLTESQNAVVLEIYSGRNAKNISFESSEEARRSLQNLVTTKTYSIDTTSIEHTKISKPEDLLAIVYEDCVLKDNNKALVVPIKYDALYQTLNNPFKGPSKNRVLRVDGDSIRLYSNDIIKSYNMTYLRKPTPIILEDLEGVTIEGLSTKTECELDSLLHLDILHRAVLLAKSAFAGLQTQE